MRRLCELGATAFLEVGPHPNLLSMAAQGVPDYVDETTLTWLPSLRIRAPHDRATMLAAAAQLYVSGLADLNLEAITLGADPSGTPSRRRPADHVDLPLYPFQTKVRLFLWSVYDDHRQCAGGGVPARLRLTFIFYS